MRAIAKAPDRRRQVQRRREEQRRQKGVDEFYSTQRGEEGKGECRSKPQTKLESKLACCRRVDHRKRLSSHARLAHVQVHCLSHRGGRVRDVTRDRAKAAARLSTVKFHAANQKSPYDSVKLGQTSNVRRKQMTMGTSSGQDIFSRRLLWSATSSCRKYSLLVTVISEARLEEFESFQEFNDLALA